MYPNPVTEGDIVSLTVPGSVSGERLSIDIYTTAHRLVARQVVTPDAASGFITVILRDRKGSPLANGFYFIAVDTPSFRTLLKLMVLR